MLSLKIQKFLNEHIETLTHKIKAIELLESSISVEDSIYDLRDTQQLSNQYKTCLTKIKKFIDLLNQKANMLPIKDSILPSKQDQVIARLRNLYYLQQELKSLIPEISQLSDEDTFHKSLTQLSRIPPERLTTNEEPFSFEKVSLKTKRTNCINEQEIIELYKSILRSTSDNDLPYSEYFNYIQKIIKAYTADREQDDHTSFIKLFINLTNKLQDHNQPEVFLKNHLFVGTPLVENIIEVNKAFFNKELQIKLDQLPETLPEEIKTALKHVYLMSADYQPDKKRSELASIVLAFHKRDKEEFNGYLYKALENTLLRYESSLYGYTVGFCDAEYHINIKKAKEIFEQLKEDIITSPYEILFMISDNWDDNSFNVLLMSELLKVLTNATDDVDFKAIAHKVFTLVPLSLENKSFVCDAEKQCSDTEQSIPSIFCDEIIKSNSQPQLDETPNP
ncbi:MAG: hypothetical protein EP298_10425 [Gammaproteobacteria bacterium]|nr:MAG: hypothetical protein EP298_10425 [Gammaproteobacteria bacterium]UTW42187.1 hypothetical protein KFE69_11945 [bacterium SCSIO 12844]